MTDFQTLLLRLLFEVDHLVEDGIVDPKAAVCLAAADVKTALLADLRKE
jgi:hypothetical protein